jgi:dipeptidyl aminopeptidase/acylaminoacyl peptidase
MLHFKRCIVVVCTTSLLLACAANQKIDKDVNVVTPVSNSIVSEPSIIRAKAAQINPNQLSLEQIMADPDWIGNEPTNAYWSDDGQTVFYSQKQSSSALSNLVSKSFDDSNNGQIIELSQLHLFAYKNRTLSQDKKASAWIFEGNIFYKSFADKRVKQLTKDNSSPHNLKFLVDGQLSFQSGDSIVVIDPLSGARELKASWQFIDEPIAVEKPKDYLAQQQQNLISVVAKKRSDQIARFERQQQLQQQNLALTDKPFYLEKGSETVEASLSPNGKWLILVVQVNSSDREASDLMPNYISDDGRIKSIEVRQRVADAKPVEQSIWLLNLATHNSKKLSYTELPGYNDDVLATVKKENAATKGQNYQDNRLPRTIRLIDDWYWSQSAIQWQNKGDKVAIMLAAADNKDRWLVALDTKLAKLNVQHRLHDDAWINYKMNDFGWFNNSDSLYYLSEETGYSQLYLKPFNTKSSPLTQGNYEISNLTLSADDSAIYFKANKKHPGIYEIYRLAIKNKEIEELSNLNGMTDYDLSPDESTLLLTHSKLTMPPELYVKKLEQGQAMQITHTVSEAFLNIDWLAPDIVPIKSAHTVQPIYARVYATPRLEGEPLRKAVVFNHGAGYLQNSHLGWSDYFREFMFHNLLVQKGYVVLDMDYRASAGYGKEWRTAIYRNMGKPELEDLRDGVRWLVDNVDVDVNRIGTYGGSYGGFLTFMALFKAPDLFQAGAALRPVSDWAHYNFGYTSNILNTPDIDPIAYQRSSPIYFAEGLQKPLLINAPMVDSNVFFQDTVRLVQRLIELEKQNFETAIYPVESHGFVEPSSWLDEYRRIYKLFEQNL